MKQHVRLRYWFELAAALAGAVLLVVTLVSREWVEIVFGVDPDGGSGALEWAIVLVLAAGSLASALAARVERRRARSAAV